MMKNVKVNGAAEHMGLSSAFTDYEAMIDGEWVSMESWQSETEREFYREKAERVLDYHRLAEIQLVMAETELARFQELKWEETFDPGSAMRGVDYGKERVQTSNISDEPYQIYAAAERQMEKNHRERQFLEHDVLTWKERVQTVREYLNLLRGKTREVARMLWFDEDRMTWGAIADELSVSRATVQRERDRAIETVALHLRRIEYRKIKHWFL